MVILHSYLNQFSVPLLPAALVVADAEESVVTAEESVVTLCRRKEGCLRMGCTEPSPGSESQRGGERVRLGF